MTRLFSLLSLFALLFFHAAQPLSAQRRKTSPTPRRTSGTHGTAVPVRSAIDAIATYDWPTAEQRLKIEIAGTSSHTVKDSLNAVLNRVQRAAELMDATKSLVLLDSTSLDRAHWLDSLALSPDAGRLVAGSTLDTGLPHCGTAFVNALGTEAILPAGQPRRLYRVVKAGNRWSQPEPLEGIDSTFADIDFPFVTSDGGITLIFSAHSMNSGIGGRDLYITRYNLPTTTSAMCSMPARAKAICSPLVANLRDTYAATPSFSTLRISKNSPPTTGKSATKLPLSSRSPHRRRANRPASPNIGNGSPRSSTKAPKPRRRISRL